MRGLGWDTQRKVVVPLEVRINDLEIRALSHTPEGFCKIVGFWIDPINYKLVIQYDDKPVGG